MTDKLASISLFFVSSLFTRKLNAVGISNLPAALDSFSSARRKEEQKIKGYLKYAGCAFLVLVVAAGALNRWHYLIKANAIMNIAMGVKDSMDARKFSMEEAERLAEKRRNVPMSKVRQLLDRIVDRLVQWKHRILGSKPKEVVEEKKEKKFWHIEKAKALLSGKRESAFEDILWGVFQVSVVIFDARRLRAVGYAWMFFLLHAFEETFLNDRLNWKQKRNKVVWLAIAAYFSGKFFF